MSKVAVCKKVTKQRETTSSAVSRRENGRLCVLCGAPLIGKQTKYCTEHGKAKHRVQRFRGSIRRKVMNGISVKWGDNGGSLDDLPENLLELSQKEILSLPTHASIIRLVLDAKIKLMEAERQAALYAESQDQFKDRVLDPDTAKRVARFLAQQYDPSGITNSTPTPANRPQSPIEEVDHDEPQT